MNVTDAIRIHLASIEAGRSDFEDSLELIERYFDYTPAGFSNGPLHNSAEENQGSSKLFALGRFCNLTEAQTLSCFGRHYRQVLEDPAGNSHGNIRQFIATGWSGIRFDREALRLRDTQAQDDLQDSERP